MRLKSLVTVIAFAIPMTVAQAQGIPVIDPALNSQTIRNQIETITQWSNQLKSMAAQYQQLQQTYQKATQTLDALKGASNLGEVLDALPVNSISPDLADAISNVRSLANFDKYRSRYPTLADAPKMNKLFDTLAGQNATMEKVYKDTSDRLNNIKSLQSLINFARDPGDKLDLANRIATEQATVQANLNLAAAYEQISKAEADEAGRQAKKEWICQQFNESGC